MRAPLCFGVCLSVRDSVPLKQSSAQYDPCPAACARICVCVCVCVRSRGEKGSSTRRDTETRASGAVAARLKAAIKRNNNQNTDENETIADSRDAHRPSGGSSFTVVSRGSDRD